MDRMFSSTQNKERSEPPPDWAFFICLSEICKTQCCMLQLRLRPSTWSNRTRCFFRSEHSKNNSPPILVAVCSNERILLQIFYPFITFSRRFSLTTSDIKSEYWLDSFVRGVYAWLWFFFSASMIHVVNILMNLNMHRVSPRLYAALLLCCRCSRWLESLQQQQQKHDGKRKMNRGFQNKISLRVSGTEEKTKSNRIR